MKFESIKKYTLDGCFGNGTTGSGNPLGKIIETYAGVVNGQVTTGDRKKVKGDHTVWIEFYFA